MEREIQIKTPDKKVIYGILRGSIEKPMILLVHGLGGNMNEAIHYNASYYFEKHGFSSFRFNLYSWQKGGRKLHECSFKTHGEDIDSVLEYLKSRGASKLFIMGHSYGLPSILHSGHKTLLAIASWDGSILPKNHLNFPFPETKKPKGRLYDNGYFVLVGEQMVKDSSRIDSLKMLKSVSIPILFITVDDNKNGNLEGGTKMYEVANGPKKLVVIKGAHHNFTEEGAQNKLYAETVKWFKKFKD